MFLKMRRGATSRRELIIWKQGKEGQVWGSHVVHSDIRRNIYPKERVIL